MSGVGSLVRGVRVFILTRKSPQADRERCGRKSDVPSRNVYEKKQKNKVSGARRQSAYLDSEVPAGGLRTMRREKTTFQPGMCMKTKESVRSPESNGLCGLCASTDSWLLTPDSCASTNEGASGDIIENKGEQKEGVGFRCKGIHLDSAVQSGGLRAAGSEKTTFQPGMCMKTLNNSGATGDVDENKGSQGKDK